MRKISAVYLRKSQMDLELEKLGDGETLARHRKILVEFAERKGYEIGEIYHEVVSGESIQDRPEMIRLLNDVQMKKYGSVIVMETDRLARGNTKDQGIVAEAFKFSETLVITPNRTYDMNNEMDEEMFEYGLFFARKEYKTIKRRMDVGKMQSIMEGNYLGSNAPYGYDILRKNKRERTLVFNEETQYVKMIFDWFIDDRVNPSEIARRLTDMGVPTKTRTSEWNRASVKDILKNDMYCGKIRWFRRKTVQEYDMNTMKKTKKRLPHEDYLIVDGKHPQIIDEDRFKLTQSFFHKAPPTHSTQLVNPFAGVLFCKKCGKAMVYQRYVNRPNVKEKLIHRSGYRCKSQAIPYDDFLDVVIREIKTQISDFTIKIDNYSLDDKQAEYDRVKTLLEGNLKKEKKKLNRLFDDYEDQEDEELYTRSEFKERKEVLNGRIDSIKEQLNELVVPDLTEYEEKLSTFNELIESLKDDEKPVIHKNMLIKSIIKRIDYSDTNGMTIDIYFDL